MNDESKKQTRLSVNINTGIDVRPMDSDGWFKHFSMHWHDHMELIYIKEGSAILKNGISEEKRVIHAGNVILLPPKMMHEIWAGPDGTKSISFFFDLHLLQNKTFSSSVFLRPLMEARLGFPSVTNNRDIINSLEVLKNAWENEKTNPIYIQGCAYHAIGLILDLSYNSKKNSSPLNIQLILDYIQTHLEENISTKEIAEIFGYTENYLCNLFKSHTKLTISIYIQMQRIEKAKHLLQETSMSINRIAEKCCFSDLSYFSKCFKKYVGITPNQYRKQFCSPPQTP